jgi:hypothetical protein
MNRFLEPAIRTRRRKMTTSRLGPLGHALAGSRDYTLHQQSVALKDDAGTTEQMYSIRNRSTGVVEARVPDMPNALTAISQLQIRLNEAMAASAGLEFYDPPKDPTH